MVSTFAGNGVAGYANGNGTAAQFNAPQGVAVDGQGNLYVADVLNHLIRKISASGAVTTLAGSGVAGNADGNGTAAQFNNPIGIAVDNQGYLYVTDMGSSRIRKISPGGAVSTLAGGSFGFAESSGAAAQFRNPYGIAVDNQYNVYVADMHNNRIKGK